MRAAAGAAGGLNEADCLHHNHAALMAAQQQQQQHQQVTAMALANDLRSAMAAAQLRQAAQLQGQDLIFARAAAMQQQLGGHGGVDIQQELELQRIEELERRQLLAAAVGAGAPFAGISARQQYELREAQLRQDQLDRQIQQAAATSAPAGAAPVSSESILDRSGVRGAVPDAAAPSARVPATVAAAPAPTREQQQTKDTFQKTPGSVVVPCRARGMPMDHNFKVRRTTWDMSLLVQTRQNKKGLASVDRCRMIVHHRIAPQHILIHTSFSPSHWLLLSCFLACLVESVSILQTAYFVIPENVEHGEELICSYFACRNAGIKFRYCTHCKVPVAKRNFRKRHKHGKTSPSNDDNDDQSNSGGEEDTNAANKIKKAKKDITPIPNGSTVKKDAGVVGPRQPPASIPPYCQPATKGSTAEEILQARASDLPNAPQQNGTNQTGTVLSGSNSKTRTESAIASDEQEAAAALLSQHSGGGGGGSAAPTATTSGGAGDGSSGNAANSARKITPDRERAWARLLAKRPPTKDGEAVSAWLMEVLSVSDLDSPAASSSTTKDTTSQSTSAMSTLGAQVGSEAAAQAEAASKEWSGAKKKKTNGGTGNSNGNTEAGAAPATGGTGGQSVLIKKKRPLNSDSKEEAPKHDSFAEWKERKKHKGPKKGYNVPSE